jgi:hypothetical protein
MGLGYWETRDTEPILENMYYDRIAYDFDSEWSPQLAVETTREFTKNAKEKYGADAVLVKSGFKGAHVYIPLKTPVQWDEYQVLWKALLKLLPPEKQQLCDYNMLQWNRLARVPTTINYKNGEKRWAWIAQPSVRGWLDFKWKGLEPLNPADLPWRRSRWRSPCFKDTSLSPWTTLHQYLWRVKAHPRLGSLGDTNGWRRSLRRGSPMAESASYSTCYQHT